VDIDVYELHWRLSSYVQLLAGNVQSNLLTEDGILSIINPVLKRGESCIGHGNGYQSTVYCHQKGYLNNLLLIFEITKSTVTSCILFNNKI